MHKGEMHISSGQTVTRAMQKRGEETTKGKTTRQMLLRQLLVLWRYAAASAAGGVVDATVQSTLPAALDNPLPASYRTAHQATSSQTTSHTAKLTPSSPAEPNVVQAQHTTLHHTTTPHRSSQPSSRKA